MNTSTNPISPAKLSDITEKAIKKAMNHIWNTPDIAIGMREAVGIYSILWSLRSNPHKNYGQSEYMNLGWLYGLISNFIADKRKEIEGGNYKDQSPAEFLGVCATATQLYGVRVNKIARLLRVAQRGWSSYGGVPPDAQLPPNVQHSDLVDYFLWVGSDHVVSDLFDFQWNILIPRLQERVNRVIWQIYVGQHPECKPGGAEWQNIEKFYGGLGQPVTVTRLQVPALLCPAPRLRKVYVTARPVDASERKPLQHRKKETEQCDSILAAIMLAGSRYVPVSCQHWALVVENGKYFAIWELVVVGGRIKIGESLQDSPGPSRKVLVGYTTMRDDEISASAEHVRKRMNDKYSFSTMNCQLFCYNLFQSIRVSHTINDAFSGLDLLPNDLIFQIVMHRLGQLPGTICMDPSQVELLQPMPTFFGTLYTKALIVATTSLLVYIFINLGVVFFSIVVGVGAAWLQLAQIHINLYPLWARKDLDQERLVMIYKDYNPWEKNASGELVTQSVGLQQELVEQSCRIVEIDDEDEDMTGGLDEPETKRLRLTG